MHHLLLPECRICSESGIKNTIPEHHELVVKSIIHCRSSTGLKGYKGPADGCQCVYQCVVLIKQSDSIGVKLIVDPRKLPGAFDTFICYLGGNRTGKQKENQDMPIPVQSA